MTHFDASTAECLVFTFKEGLLSAIAHDLKIRVGRFTISVDEATRAIEAHFDARSLRVVCAMVDGVESRDALTPANKAEIEGNIARDVLDARAFPDIRFISSGATEQKAAYAVKGMLTIRDQSRRITVKIRRDGSRYVAHANVHQPDFGIEPYRALFGTLKVQADVTVQVVVSAPDRS
ncbi:MAG TPA: YceI family protein [Candidatus Binatia bacterium]|nr:YceI family protein [Candidatus Binatia bacterium]